MIISKNKKIEYSLFIDKIEIFFFKECINGTYVSHGKCVKCQGVCKDHAPCNISTGRCDDGCSDHWTGIFCEGIFLLSGTRPPIMFLVLNELFVHEWGWVAIKKIGLFIEI